MEIPQIEPFLGEPEYEAIRECFEHNWITEGPKAKAFNQKLRELLKVPYAVFAPNGTLSLYLALRALGIKPGDEVIVPDFTFIASATAVQMLGAIPVFCDVNKHNFQMDVSKCEDLIIEKTKAIMPVHMYGMSMNMNEVKAFALKHSLFIIEDAAQALGVSYDHYKYCEGLEEEKCSSCGEVKPSACNKMCGTFGDIGSFSFYADKTITTGEGGLIVTRNPEIYERLQYLRNQGRITSGTFVHPEIGYNFRMTDIQMAIGLVQLSKLELIKQRKLEILSRYKEGLSAVHQVRFIQLEQGSSYIPFRVCILAQDAHDLMAYLAKYGIQPRTFFYPLHRQPCFLPYKEYSHPVNLLDDSRFPNANYAYQNGICLPCFPGMTVEQIDFITHKIADYYVSK